MSLRENRKRWIFEGFSKHEYPNLPCPKCNIGHLNFNKNWALIEQDSDTKLEDPSYYNFYQELITEYFTGFAICSNSNCQEPIAITGKINYKEEYDADEMRRDFYKYFIPKFFFPSLSIIQIGANCPNEIKEQIQKSFSHFYNDRSACANSIRTTLELIMNDQSVQKTYISKKGERQHYTLHKRIELFGKSNKELEPFLLAAKWIGNAGSHIGEISKEGLLDGYELLEHCIDELYEKKIRMQELKKKAKVINKTKKPVKVKK